MIKKISFLVGTFLDGKPLDVTRVEIHPDQLNELEAIVGYISDRVMANPKWPQDCVYGFDYTSKNKEKLNETI